MTKIYTKAGDSGETCLIGGRKTAKDDVRLEAGGTVDELNSILGTVLALDVQPVLRKSLRRIQGELFSLGAELASPPDATARITTVQFARLESEIDKIEADLPPLKHFILPGGGEIGSRLHLARSVCRRAERNVASLCRSGAGKRAAGIYLNRLSDWLFVMARHSTRAEGESDIPWKGSTEEE